MYDRRITKLGAQPANRGLHRGGERVGRLIPDALEQLLSGDQPARCRQKAFKNCELLRTEIQASTGSRRYPAAGIERDVIVFEDRGHRNRGSASKGPYPCYQLCEVKWFGQIVIGTQVKALDASPNGARRGQHQYPGRAVRRDDLPADVVTVDAGQVPVQDHDVVARDRQAFGCIAAVEDHVDRHPLTTQPGRDGPGQYLEVFDDQYAHDLTMADRRWRLGVKPVSATDTGLTPASAYNRCMSQMTMKAGFVRLLKAEWSALWAVRGRVLGIAAAALVVLLLGVLSVLGLDSSCSKGGVEVACPASPVGPSGASVSDRFYFVHQPLTGNGSLTVRLTSMSGRIKEPPPPGTSGPGPEPVPEMVPWAKAGVMIKDGVRPGAPYAAVMMTAEHGVRMQFNFTHDIAGRPDPVSPEAPRWLRLTREGDTLTGYESFDGERWATVGTVHLGLPDRVQIGMFAASPGDRRSAGAGSASRFSEVTAVFDQVSRSGPWSRDDVGVTMELDGKTPHHPGDVRESGGRFEVTGAGDVGPATGDVGVKIEQALSGTSGGMIAVIVVAALFGVSRYRHRATAQPAPAGPRQVLALVAGAGVVAAVAFASGLAASTTTILAAKQILGRGGVPVHAAPWHTEVRIAVGTAALFAAAGVLAMALGALIRHSAAAIITTIALLVLPGILATAGPILPLSVAQWLLRLTPAAGFAVQQSVPAYPHVIASNLPHEGYFPLSPWAGLALLMGFAAAALVLAIARSRRRSAVAVRHPLRPR